MAGQQLSYMLPPNFSYRPDENIQLGSIITLSDETGFPDPDDVLNKGTRKPPSDVLKESEEPEDKPWSYKGVDKRTNEAAIWVSTPIIATISFALGFKTSKSHDISLECKKVKTDSFKPDKDYISQAVKDAGVSEHLSNWWRPPVFLVTGIKVVPDGCTLKIEIGQQQENKFHGGAGGDGTAAGAPVVGGAKGLKGHQKDDQLSTAKPGPLILAYQLKRVRRKLLSKSSVSSGGYFRHGVLMDDDNKQIDTMTPENLEEFWDMEDVSQDTKLIDQEEDE